MPERKDVDDSADASLSMQQPLVGEINPMSHAATNRPVFCENNILFRHSPLLPKITNHRSSLASGDLFVKISAPTTDPYPYKRANKAPHLSASR
jgi:hypothetical protein